MWLNEVMAWSGQTDKRVFHHTKMNLNVVNVIHFLTTHTLYYHIQLFSLTSLFVCLFIFLHDAVLSYLQLQAQAVDKQLQHQLCPSYHYRLYPTVLRCRLPLYLPAHPLLQSVWCLCHYRMGLKGTHIEMLVIWYEHCYHLSYLEHIYSVPNSSGWLQKLLASNWHVRSLLLLQQLGELWKRTTQVKLPTFVVDK